MNANTFRDLYPEFDQTGEDQLPLVLAETARAIDATIYGSRFDDAHGALTAHALWLSPFGVTLRLDVDPEPPLRSSYWDKFARIRREVTPRFLVT